GRRRLWKDAAVAGSIERLEDAHLSVEPKDAAVDDGLSEQHTGIVDQVTGGKVVTPVDDQVVVLENADHVVAGQSLLVRHDLAIGVEVFDSLLRRVGLRLADPLAVVEDLALQVAGVDQVGIQDANSSHAGRGQVVGGRGGGAGGADDEYIRVEHLAVTHGRQLAAVAIPAVAPL